MASFRKIGGIKPRNNKNQILPVEAVATTNKYIKDDHKNVQEMCILQINSDQTVYYPLMSDNETFGYYEDPAFTYNFNHAVKDYVLNTDNLSVTNIINVDQLAFADGTTLTTAPIQVEPTPTVGASNAVVFNRVYSFMSNTTNHIILPAVGVYLLTFFISLKCNDCRDADIDNIKNLDIYFVQHDATTAMMSFSFCNTSFLTGTFTLHYKEDGDGDVSDLLDPNQTISPHITFQLSDNLADATILKGANITVTCIA